MKPDESTRSSRHSVLTEDPNADLIGYELGNGFYVLSTWKINPAYVVVEKRTPNGDTLSVRPASAVRRSKQLAEGNG